VGHWVAKSTVYRLMKRHPWRKVVPGPHHPRGTAEKQETVKKTGSLIFAVKESICSGISK
jgi:hypothetical protein